MSPVESATAHPPAPRSLRVGVLGAAEGWYMKDLLRAAKGEDWPRPIEIHPIGFADLQVAYMGGSSPITLTGADSQSICNPSPTPHLTQDPEGLDAILVRTMPLGSLEQTIFRMNALHVAERSGVRLINPPRSLEIAIDKWLTLDTVRRAGLEIPHTFCCQTRDQAMQAWHRLGGDCVVKPLFGGEGRGLLRVDDPDMAWRVFTTLEQLHAVIYIQEFLVSPGFDLRLLVIDDAIFCVRRENRDDWRTNVSRGGSAIPHTPTFEQVSIAFAACQAVGTWMAGVDILTTTDGRNVVLEVNAVPGWRATAQALDIDIAHVVLDRMLREKNGLERHSRQK